MTRPTYVGLEYEISLSTANEPLFRLMSLPSLRRKRPRELLTDPLEGRSTLRPADILVFGWAGGKHACVDLTGVSPLVGLRDNGFVAGQAALKAESNKVAKHEKTCLENQHVFIPFAFDTFGFLAPEAEEFLNRVQRVVQSVKASANSDIMYSFTSAQDGNPLQDDVRLCLGDDLKKAQDHRQRQAGDLP
ncbi:hypothetical protein Tco_0087576 [Tanacetum coccineum]